MVPRRLLFSSLFVLLAAAAAASAGVNRWTPLGPNEPEGAARIRALAVLPGAVLAASEHGVYRSRDGGAHWGLVLTAGPDGLWALAADPSSPGVVYAAGDGVVFRSASSGDFWTGTALPGQWVRALAVDPLAAGVLWAGTADSGGREGSLLRSADGGQSWDEVLPLAYGGITSIAIDPANSSTLYLGSDDGQIRRTRDGGLSWVFLDQTPGPIGAIAIDPAEPTRVYVASNPDVCPGICYPGRMLRTDDGGDTFSSIGPPGYPGYYFYSVLVAPDSTIYVGSGERVYRSLDHGGTFAPIEAQTEIYADSLALDPEDPSRLYAGTGRGAFRIDMAPYALYLQGGRFEVTVVRHTSPMGPDVLAEAVSVTPNAGYFWFFDPENVEVMVKVLDGTYVNGYFWVFYASLSDVPYTVNVTDLVTGETRTYENAAGELASVADTAAFPSTSAPGANVPMAPAAEKREAASTCSPGSTTLCLQDGRFQVNAFWQRSPLGPIAEARAVPLTGDTGYFYFFDESNVELVVKVLDGRSFNGHFWVFYGALSNLGYTITVTDTQTGDVRNYVNPPGKLASVADTSAF